MTGTCQIQLQRIGHTPGGASFHVNWDETSKRLIAGCGSSLWVYDMQTPENPILYAKRPLLGVINKTLLFNQDILIVSATYGGIYAIDLTTDTLRIIDHYIVHNWAAPTETLASNDICMTGDTILITTNARLRMLTFNGTVFQNDTILGPHAITLSVTERNNKVVVAEKGIFNGFIKVYDKSDYNNPIAQWSSPHILGTTRMRFADLNDTIIYVCGSSSNSGINSYFFALELSGNNLTPVDTLLINGVPILAAANIQSMDSRNDTLYIATGCAVNDSLGAPLSYIPVMDATGLPSSRMEMIEHYNPGLWHFDIALMHGTDYMATASEWLGIAINNISNGDPLDTLMLLETGGWTHKSKIRGDTLWVAHEGWGLVAYNIDSLLFENGYMTQPQLLHLFTIKNKQHFFVSDFDFINDTLVFLSSGHLFNLKPWLMGGQPDTVKKLTMNWVVSVNTINTNLGQRVIVGKEIPLTPFSSITIIDPINSSDSSLFETTVYNTPDCFTIQDDILFLGYKNDSLATTGLYLAAARIQNDSLSIIDTYLADQTIHSIYSIAVEDSLVAVARWDKIQFFKWKDSSFTYLKTYENTKMVATELHLKNNILYVGDRKSGLIVLDVSDLDNIQFAAEFLARGRVKELFGTEHITIDNKGRIFLSDFNSGVIIIEPYDTTLQSIAQYENNTSLLQNLRVYPNPSDGNITIELEYETGSIIVFDNSGQKVYGQLVENKTSNHNLSMLPAGVYHIMAVSGNQRSVSKIIISH